MLEEDIGEAAAPHPRAATKVLTSAMSLCGRAGRWEEAVAILERMLMLGRRRLISPPDTRAFNAALSACAVAEEVPARVERCGRRATVSFEIFRSEFGQNSGENIRVPPKL